MSVACYRCGRDTARSSWAEYPASDGDYIAIDHAGYGCDTGCCGLEAVLVRPGVRGGGRIEFNFMHDQEAFVRYVTAKHPGLPIRVFCWSCGEYGDKGCAT